MSFYECCKGFRALRVMGKCTSRHLFSCGGFFSLHGLFGNENAYALRNLENIKLHLNSFSGCSYLDVVVAVHYSFFLFLSSFSTNVLVCSTGLSRCSKQINLFLVRQYAKLSEQHEIKTFCYSNDDFTINTPFY